MFLIAALDELLVAADAVIALQVQATPLAWLIAIGAVAISAVLVTATFCVLAAAVVSFQGDPGSTATVRARGACDAQAALRATRRCRTMGARGARAPGAGDAASTPARMI